MHAKDTPFQSSDSRDFKHQRAKVPARRRAAHNSRLKAYYLTTDETSGATASYLTTNFAGTTTGGTAGSRQTAAGG
jgi:hypothetical protein